MKKRKKVNDKKDIKETKNINAPDNIENDGREGIKTLPLDINSEIETTDNLNSTYPEVNVADKETNSENKNESSTDTTVDTSKNKDTIETSSNPKADDQNVTKKKKVSAKLPIDEKSMVKEPAAKIEDDEPTEEHKANKLSKLAIAISIVAISLTAAQFYFSYSAGNKVIDQKIATLQQTLSADIANTMNTINTIKSDTSKVITNTNTSLDSVNANLLSLQSAAANKSKDIDALQARLTKSIQQVEASGLQQNSRKDWLLAEVEYLLRLANQRVLMEKTPIGALALLESADQILQETDDVSIFSVRKALAADITALSAVPNIDQEGIYLKIDALSGEINKLRLVPLTDKKRLPSILDDVANDAAQVNEGNLAKVWNKVATKLEKLVVISNRDSAIEPLLSPAQQANLLQNLHILFEQAQLALLQGKQGAYQKSLEKAQAIVSTYFQAEDPTTQGLMKGLQSLSKEIVTTDLPSIAGSLNSLKDYLKQGSSIKANSATGVAN